MQETGSSRCTLVPERFFSEASARDMLSEVAVLGENETVSHIRIPRYGAVMIYSNTIGEETSNGISDIQVAGVQGLPEMYHVLEALQSVEEYNKIVASWCSGRLWLAVAQGNELKLCNSFGAADFTTAEYFLFLAMKQLQLNPEVSTVYFRTSLTQDQELSLYRYFSAVERL